MSFLRLPAALASAVPSTFKFASSSTLSSARQRCPQCLRAFSSYRPLHQSSKRQLQTATAYHPQTLDPPPPPPRNAGVPDSSVAGGKPQVNDTRPPRLTEQHGSSSAAVQQDRPSVSVTEGEAQKSKPAIASTTTAPSTAAAPSPRPKRKLRPRKAAMTLTRTAVEQLRGLLDQPEPKLIRVGVKNRGCSGLAYHLEYVDKPGAFDEAVEQDGVKVLIDSKALFSIIGSEMDWMEDKLSARFVFKNPNISKYTIPIQFYGALLT